MNCKVCNARTANIFEAKILAKYNIKYFKCEKCGFLQTEEPYWIEEAYNRPINITDTGIMSRNLGLARQASTIIFFLFNKNSKFLDFAGGYGIFVRLMRDIGFDFYWYDPYSENLMAQGFEYTDSVKLIELVTSLESFEHFVNPLEEIERMLSVSSNILFSTELLPKLTSKPNEWWYYGLDHGQHISFYTLETLQFIANKYKLNLYTNTNSLHLLTSKKIDNTFFKILVILSRYPIHWLIKKRMISRTRSDCNMLRRTILDVDK